MIEYLGIVKLGGLYLEDNSLPVPTKPFDTKDAIFRGSGLGDVHSFLKNADISKWKIKNTPLEESNKILWHRFKKDGRDIFICDRVLINNISEKDLDLMKSNQSIYIDGEKYILSIPTKKDWKDIVCCEENILGIPDNTYSKVKMNKDVLTSNHNVFWNWLGMYSFVKNDENKLELVGYYNPSCERQGENELRASLIGFRPMLEKAPAVPVVICEEGSLGECDQPFIFNYSARTYVDNDSLRIIEKINDIVINDYISANEEVVSSIDLNRHWDSLGMGRQNISIHVTNKNNETVVKNAQFYTQLPTFVDRDGLEYFAGKFWNDKIKPFVVEFTKRQGGLVLDSGEKYTGVGVKEVTNLVDNGVCIKCPVNSNENVLACFSTDVIKLGRHSVSIRVATDNKTSGNSFKLDIYKVVGSTRTRLAQKTVKDSDFTGTNRYQNFYMTFDYDGTKVAGQKIEVEVKTLTNSTAHNLKLDYILISPLLPTALI